MRNADNVSLYFECRTTGQISGKLIAGLMGSVQEYQVETSKLKHLARLICQTRPNTLTVSPTRPIT